MIEDTEFRHQLLALPSEERRALACMLMGSLPAAERRTKRELRDDVRAQGVREFVAECLEQDADAFLPEAELFYHYGMWGRRTHKPYHGGSKAKVIDLLETEFGARRIRKSYGGRDARERVYCVQGLRFREVAQ
jgi:hypothetical protein